MPTAQRDDASGRLERRVFIAFVGEPGCSLPTGANRIAVTGCLLKLRFSVIHKRNWPQREFGRAWDIIAKLTPRSKCHQLQVGRPCGHWPETAFEDADQEITGRCWQQSNRGAHGGGRDARAGGGAVTKRDGRPAASVPLIRRLRLLPS